MDDVRSEPRRALLASTVSTLDDALRSMVRTCAMTPLVRTTRCETPGARPWVRRTSGTSPARPNCVVWYDDDVLLSRKNQLPLRNTPGLSREQHVVVEPDNAVRSRRR